MTGNRDGDGVSRLRKLARELEEAYPKAGELLNRAIGQINLPIQSIGIPTPIYPHYAQNVQALLAEGLDFERARQEAKPHPHAFATEETPAGGIEYALCAARDGKSGCWLRVSICEHVVRKPDGEGCWKDLGRGRQFYVEPVRIVNPGEVPLGVRIKLLDVLDAFAKDYEQYVRRTRGKLLDGTYVPKPSESK